MFKIQIFFFFAFLVGASFVTGSNLVIKITQTNSPIDVNPIINFSEIVFDLNGVKLNLMDTQFTFVQKSSGYPADVCNDGNNVTLSYPYYNMCKSGNANPTNQTMHIRVGNQPFNHIRIYNAYGFNNPGGFDVGNRILGATLQVMEGTATIYTETFYTVQNVYDFFFNALTPSPTLAPTISQKPTVAPTRKPTAMPSTARPTTRAPV